MVWFLLRGELIIQTKRLSMSDFPKFDYSMKQVLRAGEALRGELLWTDETSPEVIEIFRIANNWRELHAYPMRSIRYEMLVRMRSLQIAVGSSRFSPPALI